MAGFGGERGGVLNCLVFGGGEALGFGGGHDLFGVGLRVRFQLRHVAAQGVEGGAELVGEVVAFILSGRLDGLALSPTPSWDGQEPIELGEVQ